MISILRKLVARFGIDVTIGLTLLTRLVQGAGAVGVIFLVARCLSRVEQGYYYTFASIIALQVFFELGLSGIITQYGAHEYAYLSFDGLNLTGEDYYKSRLSSLLHFTVKWFGIISIVLFFILTIVGFYFFSSYNRSSLVQWKMPWILLCFSTSLSLFIDPILAFLDGVGKIKNMSKVRLAQKITNVLALYLLLLTNQKLLSSAIASLLSVIIIYLSVFFNSHYKFLKLIWFEKKQWTINYYKEIFPFQWKIALSWISGYFIFQLFNPVLFATESAVVAGQMGMTLQALNGITGISMSWISTKIPLFSGLIAKKDYVELDSIFKKTLKSLGLINLILILFFVVFIALLNIFNFPLKLRFLPTVPLLCMTFINLLNQYAFSWATYLRCHKQEPYLALSVVGGIFCSLSTVILGKFFGLSGIVFGVTLWAIIGTIWAYVVFKKKINEWHSN